MNCSVNPLALEALVEVMAMDVNAAGLAVKDFVPVTPLMVAVIFAEPTPIADARPLLGPTSLFIETADVFEELQDTLEVTFAWVPSV